MRVNATGLSLPRETTIKQEKIREISYCFLMLDNRTNRTELTKKESTKGGPYDHPHFLPGETPDCSRRMGSPHRV